MLCSAVLRPSASTPEPRSHDSKRREADPAPREAGFLKVSGFFTFPKVLGTRPVDHFRCLSKTPNFIMARV